MWREIQIPAHRYQPGRYALFPLCKNLLLLGLILRVFPVTVNMQKPDRNSIISIIILICLALGIRIYASSPGVVESSYASGIYPYISSSLRTLWGSVPFSVGDILYGLLFLFALW